MNIEMIQAKWALRNAINRASLYEDMAAAIRDGIAIVQYLTLRSERAKRMRDPLGPMYRMWLARMDKKSFGAAITGTVPASESTVIAAAEMGSDLAGNMVFLAQTVRGMAGLQRAVLSALVVPVIVLTLICGLIYGFSVFFVPVLEQITSPDKWPASGQLLKAIADFAMGYGLLVLVAFVGAMGGISWSINGYVGANRHRLDNIPPWSLYRAFTGAISLVSMAALIQSGMSLVDAMHNISQSSKGWLAWQMRTIIRRLDRYSGDPGRAFDTGLLPIRIYNRIADRAGRSDFGEALRNVGLTVMTDVQTEIERNAKLLNMAMLIFAAAVMGLLMFGFLETTYSIQSSFKTQ